jgi:DNA-binding response OmpR family regulator
MKKILIAEDDKKIAAALSIRFKAAGYQVSSAPDGFRSYLRAAIERPDLILMDITMPIATGLQVSHELAESGLGDIPVIFITASKDPNYRDLAGKLGAAGFFEKPLDSEALLARVAEVLQTKQGDPAGRSLKR